MQSADYAAEQPFQGRSRRADRAQGQRCRHLPRDAVLRVRQTRGHGGCSIHIADRDSIFEAFSNGKLPTNQQIDIAMNSALASDMLSNPSKELSREGRELVGDLRDVIKNAQVLLLSKNHRESIQKFIYYTSNASPSAATPNAPVSQDKAKRDGDRALQSLKTLGTLVITNGQFRKLLSDAGLLLRDMAADAADKATEQATDKLGTASSKLRPDESARKQIDEPAPDNQWHEKPDTQGLKQQGMPYGLQFAPSFANDDSQERCQPGQGPGAGDEESSRRRQARLRQQLFA